MNDRHYLALTISVAIHVLLVLMLPGFGKFEWNQMKNKKKIKIRLSSQAQVQPEPEKKKQSTQSETREEVKDREEEDGASQVEKPSKKETKLQERSESSKTIKAKQEDNQTKSRESTESEEVSEGPSEAENLLTRGGRFESATRGFDHDKRVTKTSSVLRNDNTNRVQVGEVKLGESGRAKKIEIIEPESEQAEVFKRRVQFEVEQEETDRKVDVREFVQPTDQSIEADRSSRGILSRPVPKVPRWLEEKGDEVKVSVHYTVNPAGAVTSTEILASSGYAELDQLLLDAVSNWKYEAGEDHEKHVVVFKFKLSPAGRV